MIIIANGEVIAKKIFMEAADERKRKGGITISMESILQKAHSKKLIDQIFQF